MDLLFLDESGKIGETGLFALGGIAVKDRDWGTLRAPNTMTSPPGGA